MSLETGNTLRDEGIARVELNADDRIKRDIFEAITATAAVYSELSASDVDLPEGDYHPNLVGAAFRRAAAAGVIKATDRWVNSSTPSRHSAKVTVWTSLVYRPVAAA
jgi:hypothetical protein